MPGESGFLLVVPWLLSAGVLSSSRTNSALHHNQGSDKLLDILDNVIVELSPGCQPQRRPGIILNLY